MSLFDRLKLKKKQSTRKFIETKTLTDYGIENYNNETLLYFLVKPSNLSVLSKSNIANKINKLMVVLKEVTELEISCLNSRESFEENKEFLNKRLSEETNPKVRELIESDLNFLDKVQIQTASAREFMIIIRLLNPLENDIIQISSRVLKLLKEQEFHAKLATKEDLKRILSVYFVQNMTNVYYDDFDGQHFINNESV